MPWRDLEPAWIADAGALKRACERARRAGVLALDTEADSLHSYFHKLCLVQLSFAGEHALVDPLALGREAMAPLAALLAESSVTKLLHGADYDLRVLDRDLGARAAAVRDTQGAAQLLGEPQTGLAALVERELGIVLDKKFQRADWGERPLGREMRAYAAGDTAYLEALATRLAGRLADVDRLAWWEEECASLESVRWEPPTRDEFAFERVKGAARLRDDARDRLAALFAWREEHAAAANVPPFKVLRSETLLALATDPPADLAALAVVSGIGRSVVRRFGRELVALVASPPPAPPHPRNPRPPVDRAREEHLRDLRSIREEVARALGLEAGVLAPRATIEQVVDRLPGDEPALAACLGRRWRAAVLAPHLLHLVERWRHGGAGPDAEPH